LVSLLLEILLVDAELLCDFRAGLAGEQVLQFDVELFLLLNSHVLLNDLLSLLDQPLLQSLDLLKEFPGIRVASLEFPPAMVVKRVLKLFRKSLDLQLFSHQLILQMKTLVSEVSNLGSLGLNDSELALKVTDLELEQFDVLKTLSILRLSLGKSGLQNLDLLIK